MRERVILSGIEVRMSHTVAIQCPERKLAFLAFYSKLPSSWIDTVKSRSGPLPGIFPCNMARKTAKRKRGRPPLLEGRVQLVAIRLPIQLLEAIDEEIPHLMRDRLGENTPRAAAIRYLLREVLQARRRARGQ